MGTSNFYITFPVGSLTIGVCSSDAFLLAGRLPDAPPNSSEPEFAARSVVHDGRVIPCLNLRGSLGLDAAAEGEDTCSLILQERSELVCLHVPTVWFKTGLSSTTVHEVGQSFKGLARLLLAEERRTENGTWYLLDTEMAVRIALQASDRAGASEPVTWR